MNSLDFARNSKKTFQRDGKRVKDSYMRREYRLFMMASIVVAVQIIFLLFIFFEAFPFIPYSTLVSYILYNPISNLYSGISAYLLWIFSEDLRRYVYVLFGLRKRTTVVTVVSCKHRNTSE
ncbi:hypothetical protein V3C99_009697 [Haemonchus contortus]